MSSRPSGFEFHPIGSQQMPFMRNDKFNVYQNSSPDRDVKDGGGGVVVIAFLVAVLLMTTWLIVF